MKYHAVFARTACAALLASVGGNALSLPGKRMVGHYDFGYAIRGEGWYGIYAPAKTPAEVVAQLNRAVVEAVRADEFGKRLTPLGVQTTGTSAEEFSRIQKSDSELWGPVVKASGFKPE